MRHHRLHYPLQCTLRRPLRAGLCAAALSLSVLAGLPAQSQVNVTTYHGDNARTGLNSHELALGPGSVNPFSFGKLFSYPVDGYVYAQPLYLSNVGIPGQGSHNLVIVATQNDSVYAFDADDPVSNPNAIWYTTFLLNGETPVTSGDVGTGDIVPQIGITGTPVIDTANGTLYVVAKTKDVLGGFHQRLHALDIRTGLDKAGSPIEISATVNGTGDGAVGEMTDGSVVGPIAFNPLRHNQRPALLFNNGAVYISWASHGDNVGAQAANGTFPEGYHGWLMGYHYDEVNGGFTQTGVFNTTPNGITDPSGYPLAAGGIWMSGNGPAADSNGNLFFETGNGAFNAAQSNYGDSFVKLTTSGGLAFGDYFSPYNQYALDTSDEDLGSGGLLLLPDALGTTAHPHLLVGSGKSGTVYLLDRDNLGGNNPAGDTVVQELGGAIGGVWSSPAYYKNQIYYLGANDTLKAFKVVHGISKNINYSKGFANPTGLSLNSGASINGTRLTLTDNGGTEGRSAFTNALVNTAKFSCTFHFQITIPNPPGADGLAFVLQNNSPQAVGQTGGALGYAGLANSIAVKFDLYNNSGEGTNSTGLYTNGAYPDVPAIDLTNTPIDLHSGHIFKVVMVYDGATLKVTITDTTTNKSAKQSYAINIPGTIGSSLAYAGFTAGTGGLTAIQEILDWTYTAPTATTISLVPSGQAATVFGFPGATPSISSNGNGNGIVWAVQTDAYGNNGPAILHAYDADNINIELYNTTLDPTRDNPGPAVKFAVPTVANGKVFVGTQTQLSVYGILSRNKAVLNTSYANLRQVTGGYTMDVTVTNAGNLAAAGTTLTGAELGGASAPTSPALPQSIGTLLPGQSYTTTLTFPATAGTPGSLVGLALLGSWNTSPTNRGNFDRITTVVLP